MFLWLSFLNSIPFPFVNIGSFGFIISGMVCCMVLCMGLMFKPGHSPALCLGEVNKPHRTQFSLLQFGSSDDDITWVNDVGVWKALCQLLNSIFQTQTVPLFHLYWLPMLPEVGSQLNSTSSILHHGYWERWSGFLSPTIQAVMWKPYFTSDYLTLKSHVFSSPLALDSQSLCMWKLQAFPRRSCNVSASSRRLVPLHFPQAHLHSGFHRLIHPQETFPACTRFHWWVSVHSWRLCIPGSNRARPC